MHSCFPKSPSYSICLLPFPSYSAPFSLLTFHLFYGSWVFMLFPSVSLVPTLWTHSFLAPPSSALFHCQHLYPCFSFSAWRVEGARRGAVVRALHSTNVAQVQSYAARFRDDLFLFSTKSVWLTCLNVSLGFPPFRFTSRNIENEKYDDTAVLAALGVLKVC